MVAVVYSGSRSAIWTLSNKGEVVLNFKTAGLNPFFVDEKAITQILNKTNELIYHAEEIKKIYFFGTGVFSKLRQQRIEDTFKTFFRYSKIKVYSDLKAVAIASCNNQPGIISIIGSSCNAAYYNGKKIVKNNFGLGYVLADEGSANWLGRMFLRDLLTGVLPEKIENSFYSRYSLDRKQVLDKVYKQHSPVIFLSSIADFLFSKKENPYVEAIVKSGFDLFFKTYVNPLKNQHPDLPLHFAGPIAFNFKNWLNEVAAQHGFTITSLIEEPIYNILEHYTIKNTTN